MTAGQAPDPTYDVLAFGNAIVDVLAQADQAILDRHEIAGVILPPGAVLARELREDPAWSLETDDPAGSVYVRR